MKQVVRIPPRGLKENNMKVRQVPECDDCNVLVQYPGDGYIIHGIIGTASATESEVLVDPKSENDNSICLCTECFCRHLDIDLN